MRTSLLFGCVALLASSLAAYADGTGTKVTGGLFFDGGSANYFNPNNGFVPAGYGNSAATTATIGNGIEFGFQDGANTDTANFSGTSLAISDVDLLGAASFEMTFTDPAFTGFTETGGAKKGYSFTFSGDTLDVFYAGTEDPGTYTGNFTYGTSASVTPEPSSFLLLGTGLLGGLGVVRRRFC